MKNPTLLFAMLCIILEIGEIDNQREGDPRTTHSLLTRGASASYFVREGRPTREWEEQETKTA